MSTPSKQQLDDVLTTKNLSDTMSSGIEVQLSNLNRAFEELVALLVEQAPCDHTHSNAISWRQRDRKCRFCGAEIPR